MIPTRKRWRPSPRYSLIFFFLVAALVVLTTATRMVDEERTQIGVMKALGYGKGKNRGPISDLRCRGHYYRQPVRFTGRFLCIPHGDLERLHHNVRLAGAGHRIQLEIRSVILRSRDFDYSVDHLLGLLQFLKGSALQADPSQSSERAANGFCWRR